MRLLKYINCILLLAGIPSYGATTSHESAELVTVPGLEAEQVYKESSTDIEVINTVYEKLVFAIDDVDDVSPKTYFTVNALNKLREDYEFDCDEGSCYAYYSLRTGAQDSRPGSDGESVICDIEYVGNGCFTVSYCDMGWPGKTRLKIVDGKIDDYQRLTE